MTAPMPRRDAIHLLLQVAGAAVLPLVGCNSKPTCNDVTGLSADEIAARRDALYVDHTMDAAKACSSCFQFAPKAQGGCGACKVLKGPVNPEGGCKLWVARTD